MSGIKAEHNYNTLHVPFSVKSQKAHLRLDPFTMAN